MDGQYNVGLGREARYSAGRLVRVERASSENVREPSSDEGTGSGAFATGEGLRKVSSGWWGRRSREMPTRERDEGLERTER